MFIHHCFIFLVNKQFPYGTKLPLGSSFLRSESDFHREFKGKVYRASDVDTTLSGEIRQLLQLQEKLKRLIRATEGVRAYP